jgi:hypothetical protein
LLNEDDELHKQALVLAKTFQNVQWVTTQMVLTELLNYLGSKGKNIRRAAAALVEGLKRRFSNPHIDLDVTDRDVIYQGHQRWCRRDDCASH